MTFLRYVALGDSFTEGVGDPDPSRPNGVRGWADRVAEVLAARSPDFRYANLAVRGRKLPQIIAEQIAPAIDLEPDLVTIYGGGNDILRPSVDIDALAIAYDEAIAELAATGARVCMFTSFDPGGYGVLRATRGRYAIYTEYVREIADRHGCTVIDTWRARDVPAWAVMSEDRLHMSTLGHRFMASVVLDTLGVRNSVRPTELPQRRVLTRSQAARENAAWAREHLGPWLHRRATGRSSGDAVSAKHPTWTRLP